MTGFLASIKGAFKIKAIVRTAFVFAVLILLVHMVHMLTLDRIVEYREVSFQSPRVPQEMDGYLVAFVTDTHVISDERLQSVADELNERQVDLLTLGGDYSFRDNIYRRTLAILSQVDAPDGIFGVEGNHDSYHVLFAAKEEYGIVPLSDEGLHIREGFFLAGTDDLWVHNPCIATAVSGANADDFVLLLTHNPDITMEQDTTSADLILSGHTHGGQITFFGIWAPLFTFPNPITDYGKRFVSGWTLSRDNVPVYVSNGTGDYSEVGAPRIFARPQVILITLRHGSAVQTSVDMPFLSNQYVIVSAFLIAWNIAVLAMFGMDKVKAKIGKLRVNENALITAAFLMGGIGAALGMGVFRHKTKHSNFKLLIPLAIVVNVAVMVILILL